MAQSYTGPIFSGQPDWARVPIARLESFHWEKESPYRPASFAQLCAVRGEGILCVCGRLSRQSGLLLQSGMIRSIKIAAWSVF